MIKLIFVSDRALLETRPEHRYALVNQALRNFVFGFTDHMAIDEFWWGPDPEETLQKLKITDPALFWKSYHQHDTTEFRLQLTKAYPDASELEALKKKKIKILLLAHEHKEMTEALLRKLPKMNGVVCIPRDTPNYGKKIEEEIRNMIKKNAVKPEEALMVSNMKEDLEAAEKNKIRTVYLQRESRPTLKRKDLIKDLKQIKTFL